ncbi:MAG: Gfo/Idh/MocA family oxidoreductase [Acidimicrobiia bacterium]|nr:Gfo/Idh/MocA family oxidoreductase [Acidimicrobiia bacterium]MDH4307430.1 Gfo/Idh/MocA family oxidoreductase [Acidimicrobiia bacterium]MDH5293637.1 Gfo/Idh/MocA family oxidoreductase [Acidimicrobiia bacterium]MDH5522218.1 Gfo/Idh/MocA family oxidoreductase [Acidimicrobiia bacterium]
MNPVEVVVVGAGQRGRDVYGAWIRNHPEEARVVAVCDIDRDRARSMARLHGTDLVFDDPAEVFSGGRLGQAIIIATPDRFHHGPAGAALELGYDVLVEKPMASSLADCVDLVARAETSAGSLHVGHVLRHTPFFRRLHDLIGDIGDVVTVEHRENVASWHMAHSFVRGNWAIAERATPMIVQKCCHDFDILSWNLPSRVASLYSVGSLYEFHPHRAPTNATSRCLECPVDDCPYDARPVYLDMSRSGWPVSVITEDLSHGGRVEALRTGPYGRCAFRAGSTVVDNQTVTMQTEDGATVSLVMHGHSHVEERTMRYDGTRATIRGVFGARQHLEIHEHRSKIRREVDIPQPRSGHGGGDDGIMRSFFSSVRTGGTGPTEAATSLESHLLAFAAEDSRLTGVPVDVATLRP